MTARQLRALEARLFMAPYVLIRADNQGAGTVTTLAEARAALDRPEVASVAGTLVPGAWAVDIDPADTGADEEAGDAAAEELLSWLEGHGLPRLLRASGRPGGRHVVAVVPDQLLPELRTLTRTVAARHGVGATLRRTLRLLTAPHRHELPCPMLEVEIRARDLPATAPPGTPGTPTGRRARRHRPKWTTDSRSEREFGDALARARAGWSARRTWQDLNTPDSRAAELGELEWRRWIWCVAVTVVAAEQGLTEPAAWASVQHASPARARQLGLDRWRTTYWLPALQEARTERPRRRRTTPSGAQPAIPPDVQAEIDLHATALATVAERAVLAAGRRPQLARSAAAAAAALADPIVRREGSVSTRDWAERAHLAKDTLRTARDLAAQLGVITRARSYDTGPTDSDAWALGPLAVAEIARLRQQTPPTRGYTPTPGPAAPRPLGSADPTKLARAHRRERRVWVVRCVLVGEAAAAGLGVAEVDSPAGRVARSLWFQRRWWVGLTPGQQAARRRARGALLAGMHRSELVAWAGWLAQRELIIRAAARLASGSAVPADVVAVERAPVTVHRGLADPLWRQGGTPPPGSAVQLVLAGVA